MSPFRELFVEVPIALLEAAVLQAQQRVSERSIVERLRPSSAGILRRLLPAVAERGYGWTRASAYRLVHVDMIELSGVAACGHAQHVNIDERIAHLMPPTVAGDAIAHAIFK